MYTSVVVYPFCYTRNRTRQVRADDTFRNFSALVEIFLSARRAVLPAIRMITVYEKTATLNHRGRGLFVRTVIENRYSDDGYGRGGEKV